MIPRQQGIVLIAVLWMVAVLSLLAVGVSQAVRSEVRVVSNERSLLQAKATGEAVINMALQAMASKPEKLTGLTYFDFMYRGVLHRVELRPNNGFASVNTATAALLQNILIYAANQDPKFAEQLANTIVETRTRKDANGRPNSFEAVEDLLSIPGLSYDLYAKIVPLLTADMAGTGRINPMAAPEPLVRVLTGGDAAKSVQFLTARESGGAGIDTTMLSANFVDNTISQRFNIRAKVPVGDGRWVNVMQVVDMSPGNRDGLPWRTFRIERSFEPVAMKGN